MTTREIFTIFGQHALAYFADSNVVYDGPHLEVVVDPVYDADGGWTGEPVFVAAMAAEAGFAFDVDASGRWWVIFTDSYSDGMPVINRSYSDDCGATWVNLLTNG